MKQIFQDLTPTERLQALKDQAYEVESENVRRNYTAEKIDEMKTNLSEETILQLDKEEELKEMSAPIKEAIKGHKETIKYLSNEIRNGYFEREETVYRMENHVDKMMETYDKDGNLLHARPMTQREMQMKLKIAN
jgi:hypothetical protein